MTGTPIPIPSQRVFDLWRDFGVRPATTLFGDVTLTHGDNTVTSASARFTNADIGKLFVAPVGYYGHGGQFKSTIASVNSATSIELVDAPSLLTASLANRFAHYGYDQTTECQSANDAIIDNKGGKILSPYGVILIDGALQDTGASGFNSQLKIEHLALPHYPITMEIEGTTPPDVAQSGMDHYPGWGGSIWYSTLEPHSVANTPAMLAMQAANATTFSAVQLVMRRMSLRCRGSRAFTFLNAHHGGAVFIEDVTMMWDVAVQDWASQDPGDMGGTGWNLWMPAIGNLAACEIRNLYMFGGYGGIRCGEHVNGVGLVSLNGLAKGIGLTGNNSPTRNLPYMHGVKFSRVLAQRVGQTIVNLGTVASGTSDCTLNITQLDCENTPVADNTNFRFTRFDRNLTDPENGINGRVTYSQRILDAVATADNVSVDWSTNGGLNCVAENIGKPPGKQPFITTVSTTYALHSSIESWVAMDSVTLTPGTYRIWGAFRWYYKAHVDGASNDDISARLYNVTTGAEVPNSFVMIWSEGTVPAGSDAKQSTAPLNAVEVTVPPGSTYTYRFEGKAHAGSGFTRIPAGAYLFGNSGGYSSIVVDTLRERIG